MTTHPESFVDNRYQVRRFLGEGGKKKVYLVNDTLLSRDVAFSLIKTDGLDEIGIERIKREAQVMGRLGDHPHMVSLYDIGEENGQPFLVSQLMSGGDVEALIEGTPGHQVPLQQTLKIADQVCQALEYAHGYGVIHRDLKPGNVWLTGDGTAKLGDFGLAMSLERTRLSMAGMIVGTVGYMPPEQAMGRQPDSRADLYSFGAMLYEMVTGEQPFVGDDPVAIISQHLNTRPVAPSWHNPDVPKNLERLILRLLAKNPDDRPESATEVREELAEIRRLVEESGGRTSSESESEERIPNPLDRLAGGVFVGRQDELELLRGTFDATLSGNGRIALVAGEPGIGKTTLVQEVSTYARLRGAQVLWSQNYELSGRPAFWAWVQLIRDYVHERTPDELRNELGSNAGVIAQAVSEIRRALPDLPTAPDLNTEHARFQLFDGVAAFLRNASQRQPLVLILDDLHWADEPSLKMLEHVVHEVRSSRILLIGTYRDVEVGRQHPLARTLAELSREHGLHRLTLRGLSHAEVGRYIELTSGRAAPESLVASVARQTEGNPFFVAEIVRLMATEGEFDEPHSTRTGSDLPQGVREVIGRRLDQLSDACNQLLSVAAVIGSEFDLALLAAATERHPDEVLELLDEALQARIVRESDALDRYRFGQAIIQELLYQELSIAQRRRWNGRIARAIEELHRDYLVPYLARLAHHYAAAGPREDAGKAIGYARKAGERAMEQGAWELAVRHYETAINILDLGTKDSPELRCELLLSLGEVHNLTGITVQPKISLPKTPAVSGVVRSSFSHTAHAIFWAAAEMAKEANLPNQLARAALGVVGFNPNSSPGPETLELLEDAVNRLPASETALRARLLARMSAIIRNSVYARMVQPDPDHQNRGQEYAKEALSLARHLESPALLADILTQTIDRRFIDTTESVDTILDDLKELVRISDQSGDLRGRTFGRVFIAGCMLFTGNREVARKYALQLREIARETGLRWARWASVWIEAGIALQLGDFESAERLIAEEQELQPQATSPLLQEWELWWQRGDHDRLLAVTRKLEERGDAYGIRPNVLLAKSIAGKHQEVQQQLEDGLIEDLLAYPTHLRTMSRAAQLCYLEGDQTGARQLYGRMIDARESVLPTSLPDLTGGATAYYLGLLSTTLEDFSEADEHFANALRLNTEWGIRPYIGHTQYAWADMLVRRGDSGDSERALYLVDEALQLADELGMVGLERDALALKVRIQGILKA